MLNVGINGFGRIGRAIFRQNYKKKYFNIVAINDVNPSIKNLAYMLKYDSTYGIFNHKVNSKENSILIDDKSEICVYREKKISNVKWQNHNIDIIIDSSGIFDNLLYSQELLNQGVKKQLVTNTPICKEIDQYIIFGVNENLLVNEGFRLHSTTCDWKLRSPYLNLYSVR